MSSTRKECSRDSEKGVHNDNIHYHDKLYQFRALVSKESSSTASPVSLISSAALHCHPSSGLIRAWAQFTSVSSASERGELHKEHSYRAAFKLSTGGLTPLCQMGFAVPKHPSTFRLARREVNEWRYTNAQNWTQEVHTNKSVGSFLRNVIILAHAEN